MMPTARQNLNSYLGQAKLYHALSHPVRLAILDILRDGEQCVCHMEAILGRRQAYISQHLMILREAGLVGVRRDGWNVFYRIRQPRVHKIMDAARALGGRRRPPIPHIHGAADCPCPRCSTGSRAIKGPGGRDG